VEDGPQAGSTQPAAWNNLRPSGVSLEATLRVEDARPHRVLRARLPFVGHHSAKLRRSPFREYCRARGTSRVALARDVPTSEADHRQPNERAGFALDDHLGIGRGPCGSPVLVRVIVTDTKSPVTLDGVDLQAHRGCQTDGVGEVRAGST
jgi:hypothetical protein